jgi:predicted amidophosphoribosyltransferase
MMRCAACKAIQDHNTIRCEQCGKPLVFRASFVCPRCGAESYNTHDIVYRYCGRCHVFVDDHLDAMRDHLERIALHHRILDEEKAKADGGQSRDDPDARGRPGGNGPPS